MASSRFHLWTLISARSLWASPRLFLWSFRTRANATCISNSKWCKALRTKTQTKLLCYSRSSMNASSSTATKGLSTPSPRKRSISPLSQTRDSRLKHPLSALRKKRWPRSSISRWRSKKAKDSSTEMWLMRRRHRSKYTVRETSLCWDLLMSETIKSALPIFGRDLSLQRWTKSSYCLWVKLRSSSITQTKWQAATTKFKKAWEN